MMPDPQNDISSPEEDRAYAEQEAVARRAAARAESENPFNRSTEERAVLGAITRLALWFDAKRETSFSGGEVAEILLTGWHSYEMSKPPQLEKGVKR